MYSKFERIDYDKMLDSDDSGEGEGEGEGEGAHQQSANRAASNRAAASTVMPAVSTVAPGPPEQRKQRKKKGKAGGAAGAFAGQIEPAVVKQDATPGEQLTQLIARSIAVGMAQVRRRQMDWHTQPPLILAPPASQLAFLSSLPAAPRSVLLVRPPLCLRSSLPALLYARFPRA